MRVNVFDIEANGFTPTKIHVLSVHDGSSIKSTASYDNMRSWMIKTEVMVAHNCVRYDLPALRRLLGVDTKARIVDTLALSWYLFPNRVLHGLESWGEEFGVPKPVITDWEGLSYDEYKHRCEEDVKINLRLWNKCWEYLLRLYGSEEAAWKLIDYLTFKMECAADQEAVKWKLDVDRCRGLIDKLTPQKEQKLVELSQAMPKVAVYKTATKPAKMFKKNGELSESGRKWNDLTLDPTVTEMTVVHSYKEPNPNSHQQVKDWLYALGWVPETFEFKRNKETNEVRKIPQVNVKGEGVCPSIKKLFAIEPKLEVLDGLSILSHRISIVEGFLSNVDSDGFIKAEIAGLTNTLRFKHSVLVNLPGVDKPYGEDIRGCLITPEGYELVGSDMSSLEDRTKQHYMWEFDPEYVMEMTTPDFDPHIDLAVFAGAMKPEDAIIYKAGEDKERVKELKGVRHVYKTVNYACVYGAGGETIGRSAGVSTADGKKLQEAYWRRNWSVKAIAEAQLTKQVFGQMWLYNPVSELWYSLRADKDRFSTLNQGTGVYCFDTWVRHTKRNGFPLVGQFHDEFIGLIKLGSRERATTHINNAMRATNEELKLNRELGCSIQFGKSYSEIH